MPGCASTLNYAVAGETSIQLYYNTQDLNLGLQLMDGQHKPKDAVTTFQALTKAREGIIVNPSSLSATQYQDTNMVVGFTKPVLENGQTDYTTYDVSIVSPVYQPLAKTEIHNKAITFSASKDDGWVSFITGQDKTSLTLNEYSMASGITEEYLGTTKILYGSELTGYYDSDTDHHFVIYQAATGQLVEYCVDTQIPLIIANSNNARQQTALAVTLVGESTYLFYTDANYHICRIVKTANGWGSSTVLTKGVVDPSSDISVTTANSTNHLFYVAKDAAKYKFTHVTDDLLAITE